MEFIPDDILINLILPKLSINLLLKVSLTCNRFTNICKDDGLWKTKLSLDHTNFIKFTNMSPKDYYLLCQEMIPIYYHGNRIGFIPFHMGHVDEVVNSMVGYFNKLNLTEIDVVFTKNYTTSIVVNYPSFIKDIEEIGEVTRVVLIHNNEKDLYTNKYTQKDIRDELRSVHGNPPIYMKNHGRFGIMITDASSPRFLTNVVRDGDWHIICRFLMQLRVPYNRNHTRAKLFSLIKEELQRIGHVLP